MIACNNFSEIGNTFISGTIGDIDAANGRFEALFAPSVRISGIYCASVPNQALALTNCSGTIGNLPKIATRVFLGYALWLDNNQQLSGTPLDEYFSLP